MALTCEQLSPFQAYLEESHREIKTNPTLAREPILIYIISKKFVPPLINLLLSRGVNRGNGFYPNCLFFNIVCRVKFTKGTPACCGFLKRKSINLIIPLSITKINCIYVVTEENHSRESDRCCLLSDFATFVPEK